jgi:PhoH-like ATPase
MFQIQEVHVSHDVIESFYTNKYAIASGIFYENQYVVLKSSSSSALAKVNNGRFVPLTRAIEKPLNGILPKDAAQKAFMDSLLDPNILINVCVGPAGTGKSTLALAYALDEWHNSGKTIYLSKPTIMVGNAKAFGPVPGDVAEKFAPFLGSYEIIFKKLLGKHAIGFMKMAQEKGTLQYLPVAFTRGCTYENSIFIIDETQNLTWDELNTLVTRMGEGTKILVLGDLSQIDLNIPTTASGLWKLTHSKTFQNSKITSVIELTKQYRSPITQLMNEIHAELREESNARR